MSELKQATIDDIVSLAKRRGFVFPGSEIYGGLANSWDYGPLGVELKNNIKQLWWKRFVQERDDVFGIDAALIMNPEVWRASGHLENFKDALIECKKCHKRYRADDIEKSHFAAKGGSAAQADFTRTKSQTNSKFQNTNFQTFCPECGSELSQEKQFNLMFKTFLGPVEDENAIVYLRPETAQAMFVDFKNVLQTTRKKLPFGIAQIGKAFRNEITPGNFIFRTREFEQMEIEYFIREEQWQESFEYWLKEMKGWLDELGIKNYELVEVPDGERAHYSKRTIDIEYKFPFGQKELYGLAYRGDFDLKNHFREAPYRDQETAEEFWPHCIEPTWGVDRTLLAIVCEAYSKEENRVVLKLKPQLAPIKVAVFPLLANKPELVALARELYDNLKKNVAATFDDRGNIGKRYYSQDEIGTSWCVTVDFQSLVDKTVTVREPDTMEQQRITIEELGKYINSKCKS